MQHTASSDQRGFTLVELLVIAPVIILLVAALIGFMTVLTGDALKSRKNIDIAYSTQSALDRIEQDVRTSTTLLSTSGSLPTPQGPNSNFNGDGTFNNPATTLLLAQPTTTQNPLDATRTLVYLANTPFACGTNETKNSILNSTVVYYLDGTQLKRRTIVPTTPVTCQTPWQRNSCKNGLDNTNQCRTADEIVAQNVSSFSLTYYSDPASTAMLASPTPSSTTVVATIISQATVTGKQISYTGTMRVSRIN